MHTQPLKKLENKPVNVITLGCSKNLVDSENLLTQLRAGGVTATHEADGPAPIVVVNTCGFIDRAKEESIETVLAYADAKTAGAVEQLYVTGCLSKRYRTELQEELPEVDGFFGTQDLPELLRTLGVDYRHALLGERQATTPAHYAYLKISEGCNRACGFCAIPLMRGKHRSRSIDELVQEAEFLVSRGVKELMLIAQELTFYGHDIYGRRCLDELLTALAGVQGLDWVRLHYAYPAGFPEEVLPVMAEHPTLCKYLDIPLQHAADPVLKRMRRGITHAKMEALLDRIRAAVPGIALRTTLLVGYPGETAADFDTLLKFVQEQRFQRLGVFQYSHEEGTYAYGFPDDVPPELKQERADALLEVQRDISLEINRERIGQTLPVLIDRHENGVAYGRTEWDSPEVDNEVILSEATLPPVGQFVQVCITDATEYDLFGKLC